MTSRWGKHPLLQPGIRRDFALIFLVYAVLGIVATMTFSKAIDRQIAFTELINEAGRLRMLSQRIAFQSGQLRQDPPVERQKLRQLVTNFDSAIDQVITVAGRLDANGPALTAVQLQWQDYRAAALTAAEEELTNPRSAAALQFVSDHAAALLQAADDNVARFQVISQRDQEYVQRLLPMAMVLGILFAGGAAWYIQSRFLLPLATARRMSQRLARGDFDAPAQEVVKGDVGKLIATLNGTAAAMRVMFEQRTHADDVARESLADLNLRNRAIESASDAVMISDARGFDHPTIYVNPAFERLTGYARDEALGRNARMLLGSELGQRQTESLRNMLREGREGTVVLKCFRKNGEVFWSELSVSPVRNAEGIVTHSISIFKDVTDRKREEESLIRNAQYDSLTGLPNGILFIDRLDHSISAALRHERLVGVLFIDIDHFKTINDTMGRQAGDELLIEAAQRLQGCLRDGDTVARLGSDEFVLLLDELEREDDIEPLAERILTSMSKSFLLDGNEAYVSASIGASIFPRDGADAQTLIRHADIAMYRAKQFGRNIFQVFSEEMQSNISHRMSLEANLRRALERNEFTLHYQPQLSLVTGRVVGAEALIRWQHPDMGMVSPAQFIPLAEETGLIVPIGEWVIDTACHQAARWHQEGLNVPHLAVNISARQFRQKNLLDVIQQSLRIHGQQASVLEIELTESMVMHDPDRTIQILRRMKEMGLNISLDDFGTGYSSLSYLRRFPIDVLKVDQSFVRDVTNNQDDAAIAASIIALAHSLNLTTVAEGVETAGQIEYLTQQKCDVIQGYFFSKPLSSANFAALLHAGLGLEVANLT